MRRKILFLCLVSVICSIWCCCSVYAECTIQAEAEQSGEVIKISGQISDVDAEKQVTILVGDIQNILYLDQKATTADGKFVFQFRLREDVHSGSYSYKIGSNSSAECFCGVLNYTETKRRTRFIDADFQINISGYVPQITGTIQSLANTTTILNVKNITDNTVIADDVFKEEDGQVSVSYTLPGLLSPKEYRVSVVCREAGREIAALNLNISSATVLVSADGNIDLKNENTSIDVHVQSNRSDFVNKSKTFTESKTVSLTIPNIVGSVSYSLSVQGYEKRTSAEPADSGEYSVSGSAGQEIRVIARAKNIADFEGRRFVFSYSPDEAEAISFNGLSNDDVLSVGITTGQIKIIAHEPGRIIFEVDTDIPETMVWEGILNVFKFRFKTGFNGTTVFGLYEDRV